MNNLCIAPKINMTYPILESVCRGFETNSLVSIVAIDSTPTPSGYLFIDGDHPRDLFPTFPNTRFPSAGIFDYLPGVGCSSTASFTRSNECTGEPPLLLKEELRIENYNIVLPINTYFPEQGIVYALCEQSICANLTENSVHAMYRGSLLVRGENRLDTGEVRAEVRVSVPALSGLVYCCYVDAMLRCPQDSERVNNADSIYAFVRAQGAWLETNLVELRIP